jgi:hypothetical protein
LIARSVVVRIVGGAAFPVRVGPADIDRDGLADFDGNASSRKLNQNDIRPCLASRARGAYAKIQTSLLDCRFGCGPVFPDDVRDTCF